MVAFFYPLRFSNNFPRAFIAKGSFFGLGLASLGGVGALGSRWVGARGLSNILLFWGLGAFLRVGGSHGVCSATGGLCSP